MDKSPNIKNSIQHRQSVYRTRAEMDRLKKRITYQKIRRQKVKERNCFKAIEIQDGFLKRLRGAFKQQQKTL